MLTQLKPKQKWIVVPEGLSAITPSNHSEPSFVYKAVLDWLVSHCGENDIVYLAPANHFGGTLTEDEVAEHYLKQRQVKFIIKSVKNIPRNYYIDTEGNAAILKSYFPLEDFSNIYLVCGKYHKTRSYLCFRAHGFDVKKVIGVHYTYPKIQDRIVKRLFFYHYPLLHFLYETIAIQRDIVRLLIKKLFKRARNVNRPYKKH